MEGLSRIEGEVVGLRVVGLVVAKAAEREEGHPRRQKKMGRMSAETMKANGGAVRQAVKGRDEWLMLGWNLPLRTMIRHTAWLLKCPKKIVRPHSNDFDKHPDLGLSGYQRTQGTSHELVISNLALPKVLDFLDPQVLSKPSR